MTAGDRAWVLGRRQLLRGALGAAAGLSLTGCVDGTPLGGAAPSTGVSAGPASAVPLAYKIDSRRPQATPGRTQLGAYLKLQGKNQEQSLQLRQGQLGRKMDIVHWFYRLTDTFPEAYPKVQGTGTLMYSWYGTTYKDILSGKHDALLTTNATRMAGYRRPIFLRWAWEMNGGWYDHGGAKNDKNAAGFVEAWRYIYQLFLANGAHNVGWVWCPYAASNPDEPWNAIDKYYPGDEYVDWVGVDGYGMKAELTPEAIFGQIYRMYSSRKPIMLAEVGVAKQDPRVMADWVDELVRWIEERPGIAALVWFDTNMHPSVGTGTVSYAVDINDQMLVAYKRLATNPRFAA